MDTAKKRLSAFATELPFRMPGYPEGDAQQARQQMGLKYVGIPFGDPGTPAATGRKHRLLKRGALMSLQRGF